MLKNTLLQLTKEYMGDGDEVLGHSLIYNYFKIRLNDNNFPKIIVFFNSAVKLVTKDSEILDFLKEIEAKGVKLICCTTCLKHFDLLDQMECGTPGSMVDIISLQDNADKIITL